MSLLGNSRLGPSYSSAEEKIENAAKKLERQSVRGVKTSSKAVENVGNGIKKELKKIMKRVNPLSQTKKKSTRYCL